MSNQIEPKRAEQVQKTRRRRETLGADRNLKLHVPEELKDQNYVYRFVNDRPGRVQQLTKMDDYDVVSAGDIATESEGTTVKRTVSQYNGEGAVLLRKPKALYDEDKAAEQKQRVDATEEAMRRGAAPSAEGLSGPHAYVPGGKNVVAGR